jgi:uncharacterized repeat protein (TIGR03803 family)
MTKAIIFTLTLLSAVFETVNGTAQTLTVLKTFGVSKTNQSGVYTNGDGARSEARLLLSSNILYGTTREGGNTGDGTVFKINTDGTGFTVLKKFSGSPDGSHSQASLTLSVNTLYGTTVNGGSYAYGTVFKVNTDGSGFAVLHSFTYSSDGAFPYGGLILSGNTLYGTTKGGGSFGFGTVFKIDTDGNGYEVLKNFAGSSDGANPYADLTLSGSTLYGTTVNGGVAGYGIVFKVNTNGTGYTVLKYFSNLSDGAYPYAGLTFSNNMLYGTTENGGAGASNGTVFQINTNGTAYTVLKNFTSSPNGGANPKAVFILAGSTLYGTTQNGGSSGNGMAFIMNTDGTKFTVLTTFPGSSDGASPYAGLTMSDSTLYGTTAYGGNTGNGTVFALTLPLPFAIVTTNRSFGFTNQQFQFALTGPTGSNVVVLASTNLQTWTPLITNLLNSGNMNFTDTLATNYLRRFYRAMMP